MKTHINVLGIPTSTFEDLVRLVVMVRRENSFLLCYPSGEGGFTVGSYLTSIGKKVAATFPNLVMEEKPNPIVSFSSNLNSRETLLMRYDSSTQFVSVTVSYLSGSPHNVIDPAEVECSLSRVSVDDLLSLVKLGISTASEEFLPFVWYDLSRRMYILSVRAKGLVEDEEGVMLFEYEADMPERSQRYLRYRPTERREELVFASGVDDYASKYLAIIKVEELPYYRFR